MATNQASIDIRDAWKDDTGRLARAMAPGAGFSFDYDGKPVGPEFSGDWQCIAANSGSGAIGRVSLKHASGLVVTREARLLPDYDAVEYKIIFKNATQHVLPSVSRVQALHLSFGESVLYGNCIVSSGGGLFEGTFPPDSFAIRRKFFPPMLDEFSAISTVVDLTTEGGRSSSKDLPFFFVQNDIVQAGLFVAFGWSGQWTTRTVLDPKTRTLNITGKIPGLEIALEPGEEIQGPSILVGLYRGELSEGSNRLRRLIGERYTPRLAGKKFLPMATFDTWYGGVGMQFDETLLCTLADAAASLGQEYFLLDAGWVADQSGGWGLGNWQEIDRVKLPNGLKPVADYVRSKGLELGLWFDPETVQPGSRLAQEHPDWILWEVEKGFSSQEDFLTKWTSQRGLLNLGRPEVQQWVCTLLDHYVREYGVRYIRYDFNTAPLPYWDAEDKPHRRGMTQLRHIQGLYATLDWVLERHPGVVLEGCASGGRRIDLEMARRSHTFWISDYTTDPSVLRFHLSGIHYFLPGNYHYIQYTLPSSHQTDFSPDDLGFQSLFGGAFGIAGRVDRWPEAMKQKAQLHVETWKGLRRYLVEDYYPLSAQPRDLASWSGWQFHDPKDHSGFIQTFRTNTPDTTHRFVMHKLEGNARYQFTDLYNSQRFDLEGSIAVTKGIEVTQEPMSSRVFTYAKILD